MDSVPGLGNSMHLKVVITRLPCSHFSLFLGQEYNKDERRITMPVHELSDPEIHYLCWLSLKAWPEVVILQAHPQAYPARATYCNASFLALPFLRRGSSMRYFLNILHTEGLPSGNSFSPTLGLCPIFVMDSLFLKIFFF